MSTPHALSPSTWRVLGLSVAAGYTGLGLMASFTPVLASHLLGTWPTRAGASQESEDLIATSTVLLGVRDISIGVALFALDYHRLPQSMGIVILSSMVLCTTDVIWFWRAKGRVVGTVIGIGATVWGWIGLNLLNQ